MGKILYEGVADVYLQGERVLMPISLDENWVFYHLGDEFTEVSINDFRRQPLHALSRKADFVEAFSTPARYQVVEMKDGRIRIDLTETQEDTSKHILWLTVFRGDSIESNPLDWYVLRETQDNRTVLVGLVRMEEEDEQ